jgi:putative phosphoribosyl transferase
LDVLVVRKLGVPGHPEVAMGAIGECGVRVIDQDFIDTLGIPSDDIAAVERRERKVLEARVQRLRGAGAPLDLTGRTALIVDDGIATGASATAACQVARALGAARVIVAAPVGSAESASRIQGADDVVCLLMPRDFAAVGYYYLHFDPTSDDEVAAILRESRPGRGSDDGGIG